jgi:hypothetical protein
MKQIALIFVTLHLLFSCSLNHHLTKAIKKGYKCEEVSDTIRITSVDSFPVIVHDSIVWEKVIVQKDTIIRNKVSKVPLTRFQERIQYKYKTKYIKAEAQKVKYQNKYITKYKIRWGLVIVAFILGFILRSLLSQTIKFYLNKFL